MAREWVEEGRERTFKADMSLEELRTINARESRELAYAFLGADFLRGQFEFLWSRDKYAPALVFLALLLSRPVWAKFIP